MTIWHLLGAAAIGAFAGVFGRFIGDLLTGKWSSWQEYVGAAVGGAIAGAAIATGNVCGVTGALKVVTTVVASMAGSLAADATTLSLNLATNQETRTPEEVITDITENALLSGLFAFGGEAVGSLFSNTGSKLGPLLQETSRYTSGTFFKELGIELINSTTEAVFDTVFYWLGVIGGLIR